MSKSLRLHVTGALSVLQWLVGGSVLALLMTGLGDAPALSGSDVRTTPQIAQRTSRGPLNRPTLQFGSEGTSVSEVQAALKLMGYYDGKVDGVYKESTAIAVSKFQEAAGLPANGIVGPDTWTRLFPAAPAVEEPAAIPLDTSNTSAREIRVPVFIETTSTTSNRSTATRSNPTSAPTTSSQTPAATSQPKMVDLPILRQGMQGPAVARLQERLRALGFYKGVINGIFGADTLAAVKAAQQNFKLDQDGVVGPATWSALLR